VKPTMGRILIVDDELFIRRILASNLRLEDHEIVEACGVTEARRVLVEESLDAVITDQKLSDGEGLEVLAVARETNPALSVVFLTAGCLRLHHQAFRAGSPASYGSPRHRAHATFARER
jgi:DNA-binding NtrC family response regulator